MDARKITVPPEVGFQGRYVSVKDLHAVIHARVDEMLGMIRKRLDEENILHNVGAGIVLTGGGAHLAGMPEL